MASDSDSSNCAGKLRVLAEPNRLSILKALSAEARVVGELSELLDLEQSLVSHHLRILREAGLVTGVRRGKFIAYRLAQPSNTKGNPEVFDLGCCQLSFTENSPSKLVTR